MKPVVLALALAFAALSSTATFAETTIIKKRGMMGHSKKIIIKHHRHMGEKKIVIKKHED
jgi:hypothetical protein